MDVFLENLTKLVEMVNDGATVEDTLEYVFTSFRSYIPCDRIGLALLDNDGNIHAQAARSENKPQLKAGYSAVLSETSLSAVVTGRKPRIIEDYMEYLRIHPESEATRLMVEEGLMSSLACPITAGNVCIGVLFFSSIYTDVYNERHVKLARMIASQMGIAIERNLLVDDLVLASITGFAKLVEAKDSDTGMHIERMQNYSKVIARSLSCTEKYKEVINEQYIRDIYNFSPLHDIGKVGIHDAILLKPGTLTPEELEEMKRHTNIGADVLIMAGRNLSRKGRHCFDMGIQIALGHHEKYNGEGYPFGLQGENIPLAARIVAAADVLDALSSKRVYKDACDMDVVLQIIKGERGKSFDPDVVNALLESREEILEVYMGFKDKKR